MRHLRASAIGLFIIPSALVASADQASAQRMDAAVAFRMTTADSRPCIEDRFQPAVGAAEIPPLPTPHRTRTHPAFRPIGCDQLPETEWHPAVVGALIGAGVGASVGLYFAIQGWTSDDPIFSPTYVIGAPMALGAVAGGIIGLLVEAKSDG